MNVTFQFNEEVIDFDENGDPPGRYEILNYQKIDNEKFEYVHVGDWNNKTLTWISNTSFQFGPRSRRVHSVCSRECPSGYYKAIQKGGKDKRCCWNCLQCQRNQISNGSTEFCEQCEKGTVPNEKRTCKYNLYLY